MVKFTVGMRNTVNTYTTNQMLCNRHYVERVDCIGKTFFDDWNLDAFLCGKLGTGDYRPDLDLAAIDCSDIPGLNPNRPDREHYGYELFLKPRKYWPLRGAPFFWCEMARELTDDILPLADGRIDEVVQKLKTEYRIPDTGEEWILVPKYCVGIHSGMSSGGVFADGINEMREDIKQRNKLFAESPQAFVKEYINRFEDFPFL